MLPQVEEVAENRVRLTVEVSPHDVKHAVEHAASDLAESVRIPGFRKGKVPLPLLVQRVGRERLYAEAVESHIGGWFWSAASRARLRPVAQPEYEFDLPANDREPWTFSATVDVHPKPEAPDWTQVEVPRAEVEIPEDLVEHELRVLASSVAELVPVEGRPVQEGDTVVLDLATSDGDTRRDYVVELGQGRLVDELEHGLRGMSAGETGEISFDAPDGEGKSVRVTVKEIKEKVLPPVDDELARTASEFDTLAELRADVEARIRDQLEAERDVAFRADAADALVAAGRVEAAGPLVETRARELLSGLIRSVERRGIAFEQYLQLTGADPQELQARLRAEAAQSVARELVLEAVAEKLGIVVDDDEVKEEIREQAGAAGEDPDAMIEEIWTHGHQEHLRDDLRLRKALDRVASEVKTISPETAAAREALWTPEKDKPTTETKLWTPGG